MSGPVRLPNWDSLEARLPAVAATMRRYLDQLTCVLRPGSVGGADLALRSLAPFLVEQAPHLASIGDIGRHEIEDFVRWLAARPGRNAVQVTPATLAHRPGTLRMFFVRISEWGQPDAPARVPILAGDLPRQDHPLPKALDDAAAAKLLRAAQAERRLLVRFVVEVLLRTGLRVGEFTRSLATPSCTSARPPGCTSRSASSTTTGTYRCTHTWSPSSATTAGSMAARTTHCCYPRENGRPLDRHTITRLINKAGAGAGLTLIHPHQLRHTLASQAINRGMSLEAISALLGHRSLDMALRYAKIANRTVADEYFAVTEKVEALYRQGKPLPADTAGPRMARLRREHHRLLGNGYCTRPPELDCAFEAVCEACTFFQTTIEFRPTLQRQRDHAAAHEQTTASTCSTGSSAASTNKHHDLLDSDYLHNADERMVDVRTTCGATS